MIFKVLLLDCEIWEMLDAGNSFIGLDDVSEAELDTLVKIVERQEKPITIAAYPRTEE